MRWRAATSMSCALFSARRVAVIERPSEMQTISASSPSSAAKARVRRGRAGWNRRPRRTAWGRAEPSLLPNGDVLPHARHVVPGHVAKDHVVTGGQVDRHGLARACGGTFLVDDGVHPGRVLV